MRPFDSAPMFTDNMSMGPGCGGIHQTLVCDPCGLVDCHSSVEFGGRNIMRETHYGQSRLTDYFDPITGNTYR